MVKFTVEDLHRVSAQPRNVRNVAVIAHVDHGKSTLTDALLAGAGLIKYEDIGKRLTDTRADEKEQGITIKSTGISMLFSHPVDSGDHLLINLIDSPGHVDFSGEVTAALRLTDGALVVVDCVEGVRVQTETVLRQALAEGVRPVLAINKLDRAYLELQLANEDIYLSVLKVLSSTNGLLSTYQPVDILETSGSSSSFSAPRPLDPRNGDVCFSAGYQGWAFTVQQFARFYAKHSKFTESQLVEKLWGDNFYNPTTKRWSTQQYQTVEGAQVVLPRGFCHFILEPIRKVFTSSLNGNLEELQKVLKIFAIELTPEEQREKTGKELIKAVMQKWIPACDAVIEIMARRLPSPLEAQQYRVETLYLGPQDDETATAIKNCDPNGPLVIYIGKMAPSNDKRFFAFGRIFSGTASTGCKVRIIGPDYDPATPQKNAAISASLQRVHILCGKKIEAVDYLPCGNVLAVTGIDKYVAKSCTVTSLASSFPIKEMKHSVAPVMRQAVSTVNPADLPALVEGLKRLSKVETLAECTISDTGEHIVAGAGELHLSVLMRDLQEYVGCPLKISEPIVTFRETVEEESSVVCLAKTPNRQNRLFMRAAPLGEGLTNHLEELSQSGKGGKGFTAMTAVLPFKDQSGPEATAARKTLVEEFDWDLTDTKKIWVFKPSNVASCVVVDQTQGVQYLNEIRDAFGAGFVSANSEGVLCGEPVRGVRYNLLDVKLHADSIHRGAGQIIPGARRVIHACQLTASPKLLEPVFKVEVECPTDCYGPVYSLLNRRRGTVVDTQPHPGGIPILSIKAHVPVMESFSLIEQLRLATSGQAFAQCYFSHWNLMPGSLADEKAANSAAAPSLFSQAVRDTRVRKGLPAEIPPLDHFCDKL